MNLTTNLKPYNLEDRTFLFAKRTNSYILALPKNIPNIENGKQLARSAGSVGANYIEANESLSKKDFAMRIKIAKKECKESRFWLNLTEPLQTHEQEKTMLIDESTEIMKILGAILEKSKTPSPNKQIQ
ncbi:MAG: four helix bundle protein [Patescibacteria group bacterium]|jgi:four helix bundle protein